MNAPHRLIQANVGLNNRWVQKYKIFQRKEWNGAHDISPYPDHWKTYTASATGKTWSRAMYNCRACGLCVSSADIAMHVCRLAKGPIPSIQKRKAIWKSCVPPTLNLRNRNRNNEKHNPDRPSTIRNSATSPGLRGVRVGEAAHPGPSSSTDPSHNKLKLWSQNLQSWVGRISCPTYQFPSSTGSY